GDFDYIPDRKTLTFLPGETLSQTVEFLINGDFRDELDETFFANLENPVNATIGVGQGVVTILNDDTINAFALPGGFIYITRGMLAHMNSESELAAVLGHEVAHVTRKHAIKRQNRQKGIDILNTVLAIGTGQPGLYELGNIFGGVLITGYSREFELEADEVGARYMAKAGYSPEAMLKTIEILKAKDRIEIKQARIMVFFLLIRTMTRDMKRRYARRKNC
ncbi:MAG: M48 family metalloprotease, partial [Proteobacteria bacterium]|nr:M48 family metalloprotease [Pseudomonadota bacterium]